MSVAGPAPLGSCGRAAVHVVALAFGWTLFVLGWIRVAQRPWEAHELWTLIVASAIVLPTLTATWIAHNLALHRGRHRRREVAPVQCRYEVDWAGQRVQADWSALAQADRIRIDVESGTKRYRAIVTVPVPFAAGASSAPDDTVAAPAKAAATAPWPQPSTSVESNPNSLGQAS